MGIPFADELPFSRPLYIVLARQVDDQLIKRGEILEAWQPAHEPFALVRVRGCCNGSVVLSGRGGTTVNGKCTRKWE